MSTKVDAAKLTALAKAVQAKFTGQLVTVVQTEDEEVVVSVFKGGVPVKLFVPAKSLMIDDPQFSTDVAESFHATVLASPVPQWGGFGTGGTTPGTYGAIKIGTTTPWSSIPHKSAASVKVPAKPQPKTMYDLYGVNDVNDPTT